MERLAHPRQRLLAAVGLAVLLALLFVWANFGYFAAQIAYVWFGPQTPVAGGDDTVNGSTGEGGDGVETVRQYKADRLWIDKLGLSSVPIIYITEKNEAAYQEALAKGVVHFPDTAEPGQPGNCYLFGHSSDYRSSPGSYKNVFALLNRLKPGDEVVVTGRDGTPYAYRVTGGRVVESDDTSVLDQYGKQKSLLTLQTSWPVGTALRRYVVQAELVVGAAQ